MFSKLIPNSVAAGSGPRQPRSEADLRKAEIAARPPTFRTARHEVQPPHDPKVPPRVRSGVEHSVVAPGRLIEATDRTYTVGRAGELHREVTNRGRRQRKPSRAEQRARNRQAERIQDELARREGKRARKRTPARAWSHDELKEKLGGSSD